MPSSNNKEKKPKISRVYGASCIGTCLTYGKEFEDYNNRREAYNHAYKTGHSTTLEVTINFKYN